MDSDTIAQWVGAIAGVVSVVATIAVGFRAKASSRRRVGSRSSAGPAPAGPAPMPASVDRVPKLALSWERERGKGVTSPDGSTDTLFRLTYVSGPATLSHVRLVITDRTNADFRHGAPPDRSPTLSPSHELWRLEPGSSVDIAVRLWQRRGTLVMSAVASHDGQSWTSTLREPFNLLV